MLNNLKKNRFIKCVYCIIPFLLFGCKSPVKTDTGQSTQADTIKAERPVLTTGYSKNVKCIDIPSHTYELYIPSSYVETKPFPVIFIFDAHARGHLPVELYKDLAESFGYILVASNNSKNGQDGATSTSIYQALVSDITQRITIDNRRIYAMGFSGGSRVASSLALGVGGIAGVIGCSAGFSKKALEGAINFNYIGIAGNEDFNYTEMKSLEAALNGSSIRHQLLVFNGKHDWCKSETMKEAFYWITFNAIRSQLIPANDSMYAQFLIDEEELAKTLLKEGSPFDAYLNYAKIVNYLDGLYDVGEYKEKFSQLENSDMVRSYQVYLNRIAAEETRLQNQYNSFITEKEATWWAAEVENLNNSIKKDKRPEEAQFKKRLLSYCSLLAYTYSNQALNNNQLDAASKYIKIYSLVDPTNNEHAYLNAILMMKYNSVGYAINSLKEAVKLGFEDQERILQQPEFESLKSNSEFYDLLKNMK